MITTVPGLGGVGVSQLLKKHPTTKVPLLAEGTGKEVVDRGGGDGEIFGENQKKIGQANGPWRAPASATGVVCDFDSPIITLLN